MHLLRRESEHLSRRSAVHDTPYTIRLPVRRMHDKRVHWVRTTVWGYGHALPNCSGFLCAECQYVLSSENSATTTQLPPRRCYRHPSP